VWSPPSGTIVATMIITAETAATVIMIVVMDLRRIAILRE